MISSETQLVDLTLHIVGQLPRFIGPKSLIPNFQGYDDYARREAALACFVAAGELVAEHGRLVVGTRTSSDLECVQWVSTLLGNIESSIQGIYRGFKFDKYAARYLGELQYRFNRRFDLPTMIPRLLRACALTTARPEKRLRTAEASG